MYNIDNMSKKLKHNNNSSSNKVPQWSSSSEEDNGKNDLIIIDSKSPKKLVINPESKSGKKGSSKNGSGSDSANDQKPKVINLSSLDNASSSSKPEPISSPPNLEKDSEGHLIKKSSKDEAKNH